MSIETQKALALRLKPVIIKHGFQFVDDEDEEADTLVLDFTRAMDSEWHYLSLQFATYERNRFILEAGKCSQGGLMLAGEHLRAEQVSVACLPVRARLQPRPGHSTLNWFRTDRFFGLFGNVPSVDAVIKKVEECLPQLDEWLKSGRVGKYIHLADLRKAMEPFNVSEA